MYKTLIFLSLFACYLGKKNLKIQRRRPDGRIVGGVDTEISEHPYQVSMEILPFLRHFCGGSIINNYLVVTASHCVNRRTAAEIRIRAGNTFKETEGGTYHRVSKINMHPQYNPSNYDYDIAVLEVYESFEYNEIAKPIPLTSVEPSSGTPVIVTGWGKLRPSGPSPIRLQKVQVSIISRSECEQRYSVNGMGITQSMICAGVPEGGKDACSGDSGGPLVSQGELVGVVSWGEGCADMRFPHRVTNIH